jgi:predicted component of viral defense system (DUF524 family)
MRREGYREVTQLWQQFHSARRPLFDHWAEAIDNRAVHWLYELWVYFKLINLIGEFAKCQEMRIDYSDEQGIEYKSVAVFEGRKALHYNQTFHPCAKEFHSYSMVLRPDFYWFDPIKGRRVVLDAKFSMNIHEVEFANDAEIDGEESLGDSEHRPISGGDRVIREGTPVRDNLYKMHAYRDALVGTQAAVILYPGTQTIFMPTIGKRIHDITLKEILFGNPDHERTHPSSFPVDLEGIGALPLRPGAE